MYEIWDLLHWYPCTGPLLKVLQTEQNLKCFQLEFIHCLFAILAWILQKISDHMIMFRFVWTLFRHESNSVNSMDLYSRICDFRSVFYSDINGCRNGKITGGTTLYPHNECLLMLQRPSQCSSLWQFVQARLRFV